MKLTLKKSTIWTFLSLLAYKVALDLSYCYVVSPIYSYVKLVLRINSIKLVEAYLLFLIVFILLPKSSRKLSTMMIWLLILISYIPMLTIFALKDESRIFTYAVTAFWVAVFQLLRSKNIPLSSLKHRKIVLYIVFVCLSVVTFSINYLYFGLSFNVNIAKVYDFRSQYVETKAPLAGYIFNWQGYILNPMFFAVFIIRKKRFWAALIAIFQFLLFSTTGHKTYLFAIPFTLVLMWIMNRKNPLVYMAVGLVVTISFGMLSYWLIDDVWISSLFARRTLLTPAQLYFLYYDFFSEHGPLFLSSTRGFRSFISYPYEVAPPHLIGQVYFNQPEMGANTGIVGDAYMNFGFMGLVLWSILLAAILKLVDTCSKRKDVRIGIAAIAMPAISLTNSALMTNLLTHGLLLALILLYLLPKKVADSVYYGKEVITLHQI